MRGLRGRSGFLAVSVHGPHGWRNGVGDGATVFSLHVPVDWMSKARIRLCRERGIWGEVHVVIGSSAERICSM